MGDWQPDRMSRSTSTLITMRMARATASTFQHRMGSACSLVGTSGATAHDTFINTVFNIAASNISTGGAGQYVNRVSAAAANTVPFGSNVIILGNSRPVGFDRAIPTSATRFSPVSAATRCAGAMPGSKCWMKSLDRCSGTPSAQGLNFAVQC